MQKCFFFREILFENEKEQTNTGGFGKTESENSNVVGPID